MGKFKNVEGEKENFKEVFAISWLMVGVAGFEPATTRLEGGCSIQLSYTPRQEHRNFRRGAIDLAELELAFTFVFQVFYPAELSHRQSKLSQIL